MADDQKIVEGAVLQGAVSKEAKAPEGVKPPEPLSEERVAQIVAEMVTKERGEIERHFQSITDKRVAAAERKAAAAESRNEAVRKAYIQQNPAMAEKLKLADYEAQERFNTASEAEEQQKRELSDFDQSFSTTMTEHITGLGIDPKDTRIDWANDAENYTVKQKRILASVSKIGKESLKQREETMAKDIEARLRKDLGIDSVDKTVSSGVPKDWKDLSPEDKIKYGLEHPVKRKK